MQAYYVSILQPLKLKKSELSSSNRYVHTYIELEILLFQQPGTSSQTITADSPTLFPSEDNLAKRKRSRYLATYNSKSNISIYIKFVMEKEAFRNFSKTVSIYRG